MRMCDHQYVVLDGTLCHSAHPGVIFCSHPLYVSSACTLLICQHEVAGKGCQDTLTVTCTLINIAVEY